MKIVLFEITKKILKFENGTSTGKVRSEPKTSMSSSALPRPYSPSRHHSRSNLSCRIDRPEREEREGGREREKERAGKWNGLSLSLFSPPPPPMPKVLCSSVVAPQQQRLHLNLGLTWSHPTFIAHGKARCHHVRILNSRRRDGKIYVSSLANI